jgi:hypothetical protein
MQSISASPTAPAPPTLGAPKFRFFDKVELQKTEQGARPPLEGLEISCAVASRNGYIFGDADGRIRVYDRSLQKPRDVIEAYPTGSVTQLKIARAANRLIALGDESRDNIAVIKSFDLNTGAAISSHRLFAPEKGDKVPTERARVRYNMNHTLRLKLRGNAAFMPNAGEGADGSGGDSSMAAFTAAAASQEAMCDSVMSCAVDMDVTDDAKQFAVALANGEILIGFGADRAGALKIRRYTPRGAVLGSPDDVPTAVAFPRVQAPQAEGTNILSKLTALASQVEVQWPLLFVVYPKRTLLLHLPSKLTDPIEECMCLSAPIPQPQSQQGGGGGARASAAAAQQQPVPLGAQYTEAVVLQEKELWVASPIQVPPSATSGSAAAASAVAASMLDRDGGAAPRHPAPITVYNAAEAYAQRQALGRLPDTFIGTRDPILSSPDYFEGERVKLCFHRTYAVLVTRPDPERKPDKFLLHAYERNAHLRAIPPRDAGLQNVAWLLADAAEIVIIAQEPKVDYVQQRVVKFSDISLQMKLEFLFRKEMFAAALAIVKAQQQSEAVMQVKIRYADHKFRKGRYSEAIDEYIDAITRVEPSFVIRRFLDVHRIADLTRFLEALHHKDLHMANESHTTLLVNCYAKLKDEEKLLDFVRRDEFTFDARNAIAVCRQASYFQAAKLLAVKYEEHGEFINILLDNLNEIDEAVQFIARRMPRRREAWRVAEARGKMLLDVRPHDTTEALVSLLCNGVDSNLAVVETEAGGAAPSLAERRVAAANFIPLFVDAPLWLLRFLRAIADRLYRPASSVSAASAPFSDGADSAEKRATVETFNTLLELCMAVELPERLSTSTGAAAPRIASTTSATATSGAARGTLVPPPKNGTAWISDAALSFEQRRKLALEVLTRYPEHFDGYHAFVLAHQSDFEDAVMLLLQQLSLHAEIFSFYAKLVEEARTVEQYRSARDKLESTCRDRQRLDGGASASSKSLWVSYLSLLLRTDTSRFPDVANDVTRILDVIAREDLLPPVATIELLATNTTLPLRAAERYVLDAIEREQKALEAAEAEVARLEQQNQKVRDDIAQLQTTAQVFQPTTCFQCREPLDAPVVHFLCRHSYHKRCLNDPRECNACGERHRRLHQLRREQEEAAGNHDDFFKALRQPAPGGSGGFGVVAQQFGNGVFTHPSAYHVDDMDADDEDDFDAEDPEVLELRERW